MWLTIIGACLRRDWNIQRSYRIDFVMEIITTLLTLSLFFFLGSFVDRSGFGSKVQMQSGYFSFAIIGIAIMTLIGTIVSMFMGKLQTDQTTGTIEAILATPYAPSFLMVAGSSYELIRVTVTQLLVLILAATLFGLRIQFNIVALVASAIALFASIVFFVGVGLVLAGCTLVIKRGMNQITGLLMNGLVLLGAVYFPIDVIPMPFRLLAESLPNTWTIEIVRASFLNGDVLEGRLLALVLAAGMMAPLSLWFFNRALDRARFEGSLAQY